jgi:hypothetical protein
MISKMQVGEHAMNELFLVTGALAALAGLVHGYGGERIVLVPISREAQLPATKFGGPRFTMSMLRFTWHFFTVVMLSLGVVFFALGTGIIGGGDWTIVRVLAGYFAVFGVVVLVQSRGRHFAWVVGFAAAVTAWLGTI